MVEVTVTSYFQYQLHKKYSTYENCTILYIKENSIQHTDFFNYLFWDSVIPSVSGVLVIDR